MEVKNSPWTLERITITSRTESLSASIATSIAIWLKNAGRRKRKKPRSVLNVTKRDT